MKAETQIRHLVRHIRPLAECLKNYRPAARRIHIHRADWTMLRDNPDLAKLNGFVIADLDERILYQDFDLIPIDTHKRVKMP